MVYYALVVVSNERNLVKGILYIVDCLRADSYPHWFFSQHEGTVTQFETAFNTPLSFNNIFVGRNPYCEIPITDKNMYGLYPRKPACNKSLMEKLHAKGVHSYFRSDLPLMGRGWWQTEFDAIQIDTFRLGKTEAEMNRMEEPYFLLWHSFRAHALQGQTASQNRRRELHKEYLEAVEKIFLEEIEKSLHKYEPDRWAVMGDHSEEFFDDSSGDLLYGREPFRQPILTDKVKFTRVFVARV